MIVIFTVSRVKKSDFLPLEGGTNGLYRNVGKELNTMRCVIYQKSANLIYFAAEAQNHAKYASCCICILCRMKIDIDFWTVCVYEEAQFSGCGAAPQRSAE